MLCSFSRIFIVFDYKHEYANYIKEIDEYLPLENIPVCKIYFGTKFSSLGHGCILPRLG